MPARIQQLITRRFSYLAIILFFCLAPLAAAAQDEGRYTAGSQISASVTVQDKTGNSHRLAQRILDSGHELNIVYLFGGGGMGHAQTNATGGLWCPDSFEDMHILRSLVNHYHDKLGFFAIAIPPVYHMRQLGFTERSLLDGQRGEDSHQAAREAFIDSTEQAFARGTIPVAPLYDLEFNFLISDKQARLRKYADPPQPWHGAFRAKNENQQYGVPNLWLIDGQGKVLVEPFRGNVYRAHGGDITINYTLTDVIAAIEAQKLTLSAAD